MSDVDVACLTTRLRQLKETSRRSDDAERSNDTTASTNMIRLEVANAERDRVRKTSVANEILPKVLWLGPQTILTNIDFFREHTITHVVSVCEQTVPANFYGDVLLPNAMKRRLRRREEAASTVLHVRTARDKETYDLTIHFKACIDFIKNAIDDGGAVYVHCHRGVSRSSTIVAAFLLATRSDRFRDVPSVLRFLRERRPQVSPNAAFKRQLVRYFSPIEKAKRWMMREGPTDLRVSSSSSSTSSFSPPSSPSFGFRLLDCVANAGLDKGVKDVKARPSNVLISPYSVEMALSLAEAGTARGSNSRRAFQRVLGRPPPQSSSTTLPSSVSSSNSVWCKGAVSATYKNTVKRLFRAEARPFPKDASPINAHVEKETRGHIKQLLNDDVVRDPLVTAILVNCVYFKGSWAHEFDPKRTREGIFHVDENTDVRTSFMHAKRTLRISHADGLTALEIPYKGDEMRTIVVLPHKTSADEALSRLARDPILWTTLRKSMRAERVQLALPKLSIAFGVTDLVSALDKMGLKPAFELSTDFADMYVQGHPPTKISNVFHKATLEITEEGSTASASTVVVKRSKCKPRITRVDVDRPFLIVVEIAKTDDILFTGLVRRV